MSCPACGWAAAQTRKYGIESALFYTCPKCDNPTLVYQLAESRKKELKFENSINENSAKEVKDENDNTQD